MPWGLTGGIATGKSTVSKYIEHELNIPVLDADKIARQIVEPGQPALEQIRQHFGDKVIQEDGTLNRPALSAIIFSDPQERKVLNRITHPAVQKKMLKDYLWAVLSKCTTTVVLDVPLLIESKALLHICSEVIVVYTPPEQQMKRLMAREGIDQAEAQRRIDAQIPIDEKVKHATIVIDNSKDLDHLHREVREAVRIMRARKRPILLYAVLGAITLGAALLWRSF